MAWLSAVVRAFASWIGVYCFLIFVWALWRFESVRLPHEARIKAAPAPESPADPAILARLEGVRNELEVVSATHKERLRELVSYEERLNTAIQDKAAEKAKQTGLAQQVDQSLASLQGLELPYFIDGPDMPVLDKFQKLLKQDVSKLWEIFQTEDGEDQLQEQVDDAEHEWQEVLSNWESLDWTRISQMISATASNKNNQSSSKLSCPKYPTQPVTIGSDQKAAASASEWMTNEDLTREVAYLREMILKRRQKMALSLSIVSEEGTYERLDIWRERMVQAWVDQHLDDYFNELEVIQSKAHEIQDEIESAVLEMEQELLQDEVVADVQNKEDDSDCLSPELTLPWIEAGLDAQYRRQDLNQALLKAVAKDGHPTEAIILDAIFDQGLHDDDQPRRTNRTVRVNLRHVLDRPLTKHVASYVDHVVDALGGWFAPLDNLLDKVPEDLEPHVQRGLESAGRIEANVPEWLGRKIV